MPDNKKEKLAWATIISLIVVVGSFLANNLPRLWGAGGEYATVVKQVELNSQTCANNSAGVGELQTDWKVHISEHAQIQKNIESLQKQTLDAVRVSNERYLEIMRKLPD